MTEQGFMARSKPTVLCERRKIRRSLSDQFAHVRRSSDRWQNPPQSALGGPFGSQEVAVLSRRRSVHLVDETHTHRTGREFTWSATRRHQKSTHVQRNVYKVIHMATNEIRSRSLLLDSLGVCLVCFALQDAVRFSVGNHDSFNEYIPRC